MRKFTSVVFALAAMSFLPLGAAEDTRTIRLIQDDAQVRMVTKVYPMKHVKALDIQPFVAAAAHRYSQLSSVRAQNYSAGKIQYLLVTTGEKFMPYVDDIVAKLDQPGKYSPYGSRVEGTGILRMVYFPKYRAPEDFLGAVNDILVTGVGRGYARNGALYWKDEYSNVDYIQSWVKLLDRPIPQAKFTFRYYEVRESTLRDVGIDYLAWKNGPGLNLFNVAYSAGRVSWDKVLHAATGSAFNWSYGAFATAPAFDLSFIRLLQQSGNAKIVAESSVVLLNNNTAPASVTLEPSFGNIRKDTDHATSVDQLQSVIPDLSIVVGETPITICFNASAEETDQDGFVPSSVDFYKKNKGSVNFPYTVTVSQNVEFDNFGNPIANVASVNGAACMDFGKEQLFYKSVVERDVEQTTGVPFLCQIPVLKYLFSTTTTVKEKTYIIVTAEANLVHPENNAK
ncbi:MAG: hypothetical protein J6C40_16060 [Lentisphaeria bacterium]|nr:hypothetical protein [Lentisphaeria bacterium]